MKIAVLDDYVGAFAKVSRYARLKDHEVVIFRDTEKDATKAAARLQDVDVIVLTQQRSAAPRVLLEKLPQLSLIAQTGAHRDHIDIAACTELGIAIIGGGSQPSYSTSELTWALILASVRHIPREVEQFKHGVWQTTIGRELHGLTLGVYGLGRIGAQVAQVGKAFGMRVTCWGRPESRSRINAAGYEMPASRAAFFGEADIVSLHLHMYPETRGIITGGDLANMKPSALLVNTARAQLIQEGALIEALRKGHPGFAAVDVYEDEPVVGMNHPLLKMPNVICTPHLGYAVESSYEYYYNTLIDDILKFAAGTPMNVVNPEALQKNVKRSTP